MGPLWVVLLCVPVVFLVLLKVYLKLVEGVCRCGNRMDGKTVVVTGANTGIGFETALDLARRNATVVLACRSKDRGTKAVERIRTETGNEKVHAFHLDLSSMDSVRKFASEVLSSLDRLDVLVHNAGFTPKPGLHLTGDGFEIQMATNHFGPFLLNHLLMDLLTRSAPSRIVVVSSVTHVWADLDLDNLNCEKHARDPYWIYCSSKLANLLFVRELARRLAGTGVTANAVHPGGVRTGIARNARWWIRWIIVPVVYPFLKTARKGAQTSIHLAVSDDVRHVSGKYFVDCKPGWMSPKARDAELAAKLWDASEKLTRIKC